MKRNSSAGGHLLASVATGLCMQLSCASNGEGGEQSPQVPTTPNPTRSKTQETVSPPVVQPSDAMSPSDAGLSTVTPSNSLDASLSPGVHFVLGDWSGSLSERRVRSALRRVHKRLWACANKYDGYGSYDIFYRLNDSSVARKTPKRWRWVYPIKISPMQTSSDQIVQCIKGALAQQNHYMRKYKRARVSGTLSIVE